MLSRLVKPVMVATLVGTAQINTSTLSVTAKSGSSPWQAESWLPGLRWSTSLVAGDSPQLPSRPRKWDVQADPPASCALAMGTRPGDTHMRRVGGLRSLASYRFAGASLSAEDACW
jgi:hypothetical protein